jgi:hypothetical protein
MEEPREMETPEDPDATLVAPRFDDEETVLARPVVPLGTAPADAPDARAAEAPTPAGYHVRQPYAPRRQWPLALILVSALAGGVLGGVGLYLFQTRQRDRAAQPAEASAQTSAAAETTQTDADAAPQPATEANAPAPQPVEAAAPVVSTDDAASTDDDDGGGATRQAEDRPAPEARRADDDDDDDRRAVSPKRGKKGARDTELQRRAEGTKRDARSDDDDREARRVDSIVYRPRRVARRERARDYPERRVVDRVRGIFEGQPR